MAELETQTPLEAVLESLQLPPTTETLSAQRVSALRSSLRQFAEHERNKGNLQEQVDLKNKIILHHNWESFIVEIASAIYHFDLSNSNKLSIYVGHKHYLHNPAKPTEVVDYVWDWGSSSIENEEPSMCYLYVGGDKTERDLADKVFTGGKVQNADDISDDVPTLLDKLHIPLEVHENYVEANGTLIPFRSADSVSIVNERSSYVKNYPSPLLYCVIRFQ